jgi:hypothetical protein
MSDHRSRRIGRRTAEHLLRGRSGATGHDRLSDLLTAAAAPARDGELTGEQAAVAAFRAARLEPAPQRRRPWMLKIALANVLTAKIAGVTALAAGGIALAAATGTLPGHQREAPVLPASSEVATTTPSAQTPEKKPDNTASPSPSLKGLCQAYTAGAGADHGKAKDNPAFSALVTAAGGAAPVPAFCADLLGDKPGKPEKPDHTQGKPTHPNR